MKGKYRIIVQNSLVRYDFEIKRNITIIRGDSATGKTTLVEMIREYYEDGIDSGIDLVCDKTCSVLAGRDWKLLLSAMKERIIFIDEGNNFIFSTEFAKAVQESDNYFVIITREGLPNLPYSVEEIYGIKESGKYATIKKTFNELYHIYNLKNYHQEIIPERLIVEDSNSGYEFFCGIGKLNAIHVISAHGKSNIFSLISESDLENTLIIADGAAFGAEMDRISKLIKHSDHIFLYLPESFEWIILKSGIIPTNNLKAKLNSPYDFIDSSLFFSWERYFTVLLVEETKNTYLQYAKKRLNPVYLDDYFSRKIINVMERIKFL